jgi:phosphoglycolate phosphatase
VRYTAVLFDLDGTLLDTLRDIADATNRALGNLGFPPHETEAYKYFIGEGREALAYHALAAPHRDAATVDRLLAGINEEYERCWADHTLPYPGITGLLDELAARGISLAVLSNKAHDLTQMMVSGLLADWRFAAVTGALPSVPKKPDPAAALRIAHFLGILPAEFIYLGDSAIDMKTATGAGMHPVGAAWGFRTVDELLDGGAKAIIKRPVELLRLL